MSYSVEVGELAEWLAGEATSRAGDVAILAGHFAIFSAGGTPGDLLDGTPAPPAGAADMLAFTRTTWHLACELAKLHPERPFAAVPLVDDIQFVRPLIPDRSTAERLASALARQYLEQTPRLPAFHLHSLAAHGVPESRVLRACDAHWLFSERQLRSDAVRRLRAHHRDGGGRRAGLASSDGGSTMTVTLPEHGEYCVVQSGHTTCAGGYVELLARLHQRGIRKLIAMVPMRCIGQVALGTELAHWLFPLPRLTVVNVGMPAPGTTDKASVVAGPEPA
jgi:hypothetical protein